MAETLNKSEFVLAQEPADSSQLEVDLSHDEKQGSSNDRTAMWQMGKKQELKVCGILFYLSSARF